MKGSVAFQDQTQHRQAALDHIREIVGNLISQYEEEVPVDFRRFVDFLIAPVRGNLFRTASFFATLFSMISQQIKISQIKTPWRNHIDMIELQIDLIYQSMSDSEREEPFIIL
ncbi:MAG: hypothetical protein IH840_18240 [Candidatus Heimdallarchaeota archaeon]|nr:hypothetical protein [Candidatus Heimdallarchaeota archaeon]